MKTWNEVTNSPEYQALPPEAKEAARQQYFNEVVAPRVPEEHRSIAKSQFDQDTRVEEAGMITKGLRQGAGVAQGAADFLGAIPGAVGGATLGAVDVMRGEDPKIALQGVHGAMEHLNLPDVTSRMLPKDWYNPQAHRQTEGYKYSPGTIAGEAIGKSLEGYGKLAGWAAAIAGHDDPAKLDAATQIALMAAMPFARGGKPKPGSAEFYKAITEQRPTISQSRESQEHSAATRQENIQNIRNEAIIKEEAAARKAATEQPIPFETAAVEPGPRGIEITQRGGTSAPPTETFARGVEIDMPRPTTVLEDGSRPPGYRAMESIDFTPSPEFQRPTLIDRAGKNKEAIAIADTITKQQEYVARLERELAETERIRESTLRGDESFTNYEPTRGWKETTAREVVGAEPRDIRQLNLEVKDLRNRLDGAKENLNTYKSQFETKLENIQKRPFVPKGQRGHIGDWLKDAFKEREKLGWNPEWPFIPADLINKDFRELIRNDPELSKAEKDKILSFAPGGANEGRLSLPPRSQRGMIGDEPPRIGGRRATIDEQAQFNNDRIRDTKESIAAQKQILDSLDKGDYKAYEQFKQVNPESRLTPLEYKQDIQNSIRQAEIDLVRYENEAKGYENLKLKPTTNVKPILPPKERGSISPDVLTLGLNKLLNKGKKSTLKEPPREPPEKGGKQDIFSLAEGENRPLSEVIKGLPKEELSRDLPDTFGTRQAKDLTNASFTAHFADHPLATYVANRFNNVIRTTQLRINQLKQGTRFKIMSMRSPIDPNSPKGMLQRLPKKDLQAMIDVANEFNGARDLSRAELETLGLSKKAIETWEVFRNAIEEGFKFANEITPNNPIPRIPGWWFKVREGDFKLSFYERDPITGEKVEGPPIYSDLFKTRGFGGLFGREKALKELQKKFPDMVVKKDDVPRETRGNPYNVSTIPMDMLLQSMQKGDPRRNAIESALREMKSRQGGYRRHAIKRNNVGGGELTVDNFWKGFESWMDSIGIYRQNALMRAIDHEFKTTPELKTPKLKEWVSQYTNLATGGFDPGWAFNKMEAGVNAIGSALTAGQRGGDIGLKMLNKANQYFISKALMWFNPAFLLATKLQPYNFASQWLLHHQANGMSKGSVAKAMYKGEEQIIKRTMGKGEQGFENLVQYLLARGQIDPTMVHYMDVFGSSSQNKAVSAFRHLTGTSLVQLFESIGRYEVAAFGYEFAKANGKSGKDLNMWVERLVTDVMTDYSKQERPAWVGKTGIVGTALGPLSVFASNFWSTTMLFLKDAVEGKGSAPMAMHIAQTAVWGGLTGMLGMQIADWIIELLKITKALPAKTPNVSEMIMANKDIPDIVSHGVTSGWSGMNLGASMSAPDMVLPSTKSVPGIRLITDSISALKDAYLGTKSDEQRFLKTVLPNTIAALMDIYDVDINTGDFSIRPREVGEMMPNVNQRGFGQKTLTEQDILARHFNTKTLDEVRGRDLLYGAKRNEAMIGEQQQRLVDLGADAMMTGQGDISKLQDQAMELGMNLRQYMQNVYSVMKQREMDAQERFTGRIPHTPRQLRREEMIERR